MSAQPIERPYPLIVFYVLFFMTVGVSLPFMPGYFKTLGFTGAESGALLAVGPSFALFMPPLWGHLADRSGRPGLVLLVAEPPEAPADPTDLPLFGLDDGLFLQLPEIFIVFQSVTNVLHADGHHRPLVTRIEDQAIAVEITP